MAAVLGMQPVKMMSLLERIVRFKPLHASQRMFRYHSRCPGLTSNLEHILHRKRNLCHGLYSRWISPCSLVFSDCRPVCQFANYHTKAGYLMTTIGLNVNILHVNYYSTKASELTLANENFENYLNSLVVELEEIRNKLTKSGSEELIRRQHELIPVVDVFTALQNKYAEAEELTKLQLDEEMKSMAVEDHKQCLKEISELEAELLDLLVTEEKVDECDIILELSAGVGGAEAMLFTKEMFEMYQNFSAYKGWTFTVIDVEENEIGGYRNASAAVSGHGVYCMLKYEGGVHRVQRVPKTEKAGRVHTSTMSVAVYPQPSEVDIQINPKDLRIDTFRASGKGGQHVNTTDSAVRIVHIPSGEKAECQQERSQIKNREIAMLMLKARLYKQQLEEQKHNISSQRKLQVGSKGRSEKQRTYNFNQDRVTDHRLGRNIYNISGFMAGGEMLEDLIHALLEEAKVESVLENVDNFVQTRDHRGKKKTK